MDGTADVAIRYCPSCSHPEHGNLACDYSFAFAIDLERSALPTHTIHWRIMDHGIFEVHPGSPMSEDDHCCLCALRNRG
jgi:hypothetical protein